MLHKVRITEHNGEQEYIHDVYVNAPTLEAATEWAKDFTATWHYDVEPLLNGGYQINSGEVYWRLSSVSQCNTIEVYDVRKCMILARIVAEAIY